MNNGKYDALFQPIQVGGVELKNRYIMGPMGMESWQIDPDTGTFTQEAIDYFAERAKGGFGAIITGAHIPDQIVAPFGKTILSHKDISLEQGKKLTEACGQYGTKVFLELGFGVGRNYPTFKAPSALPAFNYPNMISPVITVEEMHLLRDQIIEAAVLAKDAGYAGIDIHTLHWGYLLDQFAMEITNQRTDEYGGSLENRLRLLKETVEGIHEKCGNDFPVTIGLGVKSYIKALNKASLMGDGEVGRTVEEAVEIAKLLEKMGIAAIYCDVGIYDSFYHACPPSYMAKGHAVELYKPIKDAVNIPVFARSRMGDPDLNADVLAKGQADGIVLSRPSLADPEYPNKVAANETHRIRPCIGCNMGCIGRLLESTERPTCALNPRAGFEGARPVKKSKTPKKIAVVGGGVAGLQACITAVECGHTVELFEKTNVLGGELNAAGAHDNKADIHNARDWFIREVKENNVPIHMNTEFTEELCEAGKFDLVIMATGAASVMPASIKGIEKAVSAVELLESNMEIGDKVIVVGGGMVGCETAVDLAMKGKRVTLVEQLHAILSAEFVPQQHKAMLKDMIDHYSVEVYEGYGLSEVTDTGAVISGARKLMRLNEKGNVIQVINKDDKIVLDADKVVISIGLRPVANLTKQLTEKGVAVIEVGSAKRAGNVLDAVHDAFNAVYDLE